MRTPIVTTTQRLPTTFSDEDDEAFLNNLVRIFRTSRASINNNFLSIIQREYSKIINLSTGKSDFANRILELALNRTGKSFNTTKDKDNEIGKDPVKMVHQNL
jgi:hypothetical protein